MPLIHEIASQSLAMTVGARLANKNPDRHCEERSNLCKYISTQNSTANIQNHVLWLLV